MRFGWLTRARGALAIVAVFAAVALISLSASSGSRAARPKDIGGEQLTRYSIVHGCFTLNAPTGTPIAASDGPLRFQAAALGVYLLYTPGGQYLVPAAGDLTTAAQPSPAAEWTVTGD